MTEFDILKIFGIEVKHQSLIFYDDESEETILEFSEIKNITIEEAYVPIADKLLFWIKKLIVIQTTFGVPFRKRRSEDYRDFYELEIELNDNIVLSRKVSGIQFYEAEEFINELNKKIMPE